MVAAGLLPLSCAACRPASFTQLGVVESVNADVAGVEGADVDTGVWPSGEAVVVSIRIVQVVVLQGRD